MSRIYGGIHFTFSNTDGQAVGQQVGDWTLNAFDLSQDTVPPKVVLDQTSGLVTNQDPTITGYRHRQPVRRCFPSGRARCYGRHGRRYQQRRHVCDPDRSALGRHCGRTAQPYFLGSRCGRQCRQSRGFRFHARDQAAADRARVRQRAGRGHACGRRAFDRHRNAGDGR